MDNGSIALSAWSHGLAGAAYSAFAGHLLRAGYGRRAGPPAMRWMLAAVAATAAWGWLGLADQFATIVLFQRLATAASLLAYAAWFGFLLGLLRPAPGAPPPAGLRWLGPLAWMSVPVCLLLQLAAAEGHVGLDERTRSVLLAAMVLPLIGLVLVEQLLRSLHEDSLWNAKPLCLGLGGGFLFDLYLYSNAVLFNGLDGDAVAIRGAAYALMVPLLLLSTSRRRDWIAHLRVSRQAAFHSATLLLAGAYLLFISGVGYYVRLFGGDWGRALQLGLMFVAIVLLTIVMLSGAVRAKLRLFLGKHFFRYRYDYREEWLRFTEALSAQTTPQQMGERVIRGLADLLESPGGALWARQPADGSYRQGARWNMPVGDAVEAPGSELCRFLQESGAVINLDEYRLMPRRYGELRLPPWLLELPGAWLVVPLAVGDELVGFVVLGQARARVDVDWEVNDLLKTAGRQAASFLAQMQATEALLEVRKFDAFNRMSAFVVHDLKNIVTQLSLMLKNAKRLHANPEFQQDMLLTVENALDRMRQLMVQLREGATPAGTAFGVDLGQLARRIEADVQRRGRKLEAEVAGPVLTRGHEERLERVIGHIVHNALDATETTGRVWLRIGRAGSQAHVEVGDTGHGMTEEFIRERLFKPFQTTKQAGMGIGAYESFQYVRELGGSIDVDSEPGRGTVVRLRLPVFEARKESDLEALRPL
jgi:putative PEP-CTERM system histidine kinase